MDTAYLLSSSKNKFQCGMVYLFAILATLGVGPLCVIRYLNGEVVNTLIDLVVVLVSIGSAIYTWRRGHVTQLISNITALLYSAGAVVVAYLNDPIFVFWLFPALLANLFLLTARAALVANLSAFVAALPITVKLETPTETFAMLLALLICNGMVYVFALLTSKQQSLLEDFATQDPLTHLHNRRTMDEAMNQSVEDFARNQTPATLMILDLDFFKLVNDKFGHDIGDLVLVNLAQILTKRVRKTDRVFRFGGEEFVVLARNTSLTDGLVLAEQLRAQIEMDLKDPEGALTASFGCAELLANETAKEWFVRADKAVYLAKQQGRNCVVAAD